MKCCFKKQNISKVDMNIRVLISFILIVFSFLSNIFTPLIMAFILLLTVFKRSCLVYRLLKINEDMSLLNEYAEALPKYNPEPVFILNNNGKIVFKNKPAKELFLESETFEFLYEDKNIEELIEQDSTFKIQHTMKNKKTYLFTFVAIKDIDLIMVYSVNITETIKANEEIINI